MAPSQCNPYYIFNLIRLFQYFRCRFQGGSGCKNIISKVSVFDTIER
nr:MAG TPA: hypothetical protein [Caudoviricetes sp.]DAK65352.1 MAG TPA: hypothetical protein [Caudoviricetes sp.]